jgi:hypothetical protein
MTGWLERPFFEPARDQAPHAKHVRGDLLLLELRPETQRQMVQNGPHPTGKYRVVGPLSNMPELAKAFGCAEGSEMVRAKRCEVW